MAKALVDGVRFSYVNLDEPRSFEGQEPKYSLTVLIPKGNKEAIAEIKNAIKQAQAESLAKFGGKIPPNLRNPIHDGDELKDNGEEYGPECKGHYFLRASSKAKSQPSRKVQTGIGKMRNADLGEIKSGDYGSVSLNFAGYNVSGNKGIGAYINGVLKKRDGEPLGGGSTPENDFKDFLKNDDFDKEPEIDPLTGLPVGDDELPF